jgi:predicted acyltransferase
MEAQADLKSSGDRLYSLDFFRGLTMFLLIAESTNLYSLLTSPSLEASPAFYFFRQFEHHPWHGLRFWDLIQPYFMFIVGVAMPYSLLNRRKRGQSDAEIRKHVLTRALLLLFLGWALYCIEPGKIEFRFQNVLAQLSVTYLLAYLVMDKPARTQIIFSFILIAITEIIYRVFPVEGFNHPFVANENFGTWLDLQYGGEDLGGHWVSFNAIPTAAHTIWGVLAGQLMMSNKTDRKKLQTLVIAGLIGVIAGYALDPITPIIKRICTSSFILASGGWTLLSLAFWYWFIDILKQKNWTFFFAIVGMNPLFIYLFANVGGTGLVEHIVHPFSMLFFGWTGEIMASILTSLVVLFLLWYMCYWLYKKKIFIRI